MFTGKVHVTKGNRNIFFSIGKQALTRQIVPIQTRRIKKCSPTTVVYALQMDQARIEQACDGFLLLATRTTNCMLRKFIKKNWLLKINETTWRATLTIILFWALFIMAIPMLHRLFKGYFRGKIDLLTWKIFSVLTIFYAL